MRSFEPNPAALITSEMLRQDFIPDAHEALRIIHLDEAETGKDTLIALSTAAVGIASSAGILALSGFTLPILAPLTVLGLAGLQAWNYRITQRDRQAEADFLSDHPEILDLVEKKIDQGEPLGRVAAALETAYRAYVMGDAPQLSLSPAGKTAPAVAPAVGAQTQLGAIPVQAGGVAVLQDDSRPEAIAPVDGPLSVLLANPYQNRLIFGGQRTGKSFLAAIASRYLASKGIKTFHLNLSHTRTSEGRDEDAEYWQHAAASIRFDLGSLSSETAKDVIDKAINMVRDFWAQTGAILVVDEAPAQSATSNMHRGLLDPLNAAIASLSSQCNSTGVKRGKSVWAIGPEFIAANMTQHGKSFCKTGSLVHVFIHPASQSEWNGQRLVFDTGLFKQLSTNFQGAILEPSNAEICDRTAQIEGSFYSLDGLTLPDWDGKKCVAAAIASQEPDHKNQAEKPKPAATIPAPEPEKSAAPIEQQIADFIKAYPAGNGGLKLREVKKKFKRVDPQRVEGIAFTLARCYPSKFRINREIINGGESIKIEAINQQ